jgi:hypothetical protein
MKIDLESPRYYRGLGDIVMWAWLAEGSRASTDRMVFHRTSNLDLMGLLGLTVDPQPGGVTLDEVYQIETRDVGRRPRIDYIRDALGLAVCAARPKLIISEQDRAWASERVAELGSSFVLLFPQSAWKTREWPANYWVDLAWHLKRLGIPVLVMLQADDSRFHNTPLYWWNTPLPRMAALMAQASLVIGNDSFPAHLAGTIGVPTLALMGPTGKSVFSHIPDVECLAATSLDCTGCYFQAPFRAACDQGCMSLYRLFPDQVVQRSLEKLGLG